ncbi:hypothetical protein ABBQ38_002545 [Trebouxia sp. C0009 RCD-2024]
MRQCLAAVQISGMCRMVMFVSVGSVLAGANPQGSMDLVLLPIICSIRYKSSSQVTAAFAAARNEELLQHHGFVETDNIHDFHMANVLEFDRQTAVDQPNEEQLQEDVKRPALLKALTEATSHPTGIEIPLFSQRSPQRRSYKMPTL